MGSTEHAISDNEKIMVLINYSAEDITTLPILKQGWKITSTLYGNPPKDKTISIKANDAMVLSLKK